jgi:hypothetical protein
MRSYFCNADHPSKLAFHAYDKVPKVIISYSKKFALLAPWKTASQTAHASLQQYNESPYPRHFHFNHHLKRAVHQHLTLADFLTLPEGKNGFKIGSFVRNPYDRAYSGFLQIQRDFEVQPKMSFDLNWIGEMVRDQISENMRRVILAEFDFEKWICNLPEYEVYEIGRNTNLPLHPAHYWTHAIGYAVDFVGKVERFDRDFSKFCELIGIDTPDIFSQNATSVTEHEKLGYSHYAGRMSRRSIERINHLFERDFELFGYEML